MILCNNFMAVIVKTRYYRYPLYNTKVAVDERYMWRYND